MIAIEYTFLQLYVSIMPIVCAITLLVLRAGASRVFFDVVGTFQANRLIKDAKTASVVFQSLMLDAISGVQESGQAIGEQFSSLMNSMVPVAREIETARIELEKFLNVADGSIGEVETSIQKIGLAYGFAADDAFSAAARMAQLTGVLGQGTMEVGTETGMQFGLISGMQTEAAMQRMINLQQQTKFMTNGIAENATEQERVDTIRTNSIRVLDQLNTVENRSAATMEQITYVMNQFASQAHLTGESIAAMAAQSAVLIEAGEEQGKGGRALRMIYARLGANTNGAADAFHALGIATHDENENLRKLSDIMKDLNKIYPDLEMHQKTTLAQQVAGNRHYTRFLKLSENYNRAIELEFEATMRLSPALEEINRRRSEDLFLLEQSEARLKNMSGAIGNSLVPALAAATNRQADLNAEIAMFIGSTGIGEIVGKMAVMGQVFTTAVAPMFNTVVNLQMLTVAMGTYKQVVRALAGEELINQDAYGNKAAAYSAGTAQLMHYTAATQTLTDGLKMQNVELKQLSVSEQNKIMTQLELIYNANKINLLRNEEAQKSIQASFLTDKESKASKVAVADLVKKEAALKKLNLQRANEIKAFTGKRYASTKAGQASKKAISDATLQQQTSQATVAALERETQEHMGLVNALNLEAQAVLKSVGIKDVDNLSSYDTIMILELLGSEYEVLAQKIAASSLQQDIASEIKRKAMLKEQAAHASQMNQMSMKLGMAGSAMMMFGKSQKTMRIGLVMNTAAMVVQMHAMKAKTTAHEVDNLVTKKAVVANITFTASMKAVAAGAKATAASIIAASLAVAKAVPYYAALIAISWALVEVLELLGIMGNDDNLNFESDFESIDSYKASTSELIDMLKDEKHTIDSLSTSIKEKTDLLKGLEKFEDTVSKARIEQLHTELGLETSLLDIKRAQSILAAKEAGTFNEGSVSEYFKLAKDIDDLEDKFGMEGLTGKGVGIGWDTVPRLLERIKSDLPFAESSVDQINKATQAFEDFGVENQTLFDLMKERGIEGETDWENFLEGIESGLEILTNAEKDALGIMVTGYEDATEALQEFANTREELFYGFSSANLTGNLVKQVVQQGVETLINTTEVIMSNTFNGMTTTEAAAQILDEIERGAGLRGMNLSNS